MANLQHSQTLPDEPRGMAWSDSDSILGSREWPDRQDGKWKCTSCREATGVPSRVAGW
jgi:hypothetical protein